MRAHAEKLPLCLLLVGAAVSFCSAASAVTIDWTFVGNPGNACDPQTQPERCYGSVAYGYNISTYEVTNSQYAEFLNAVADTDTNALYNTNMGSGPNNYGGITRGGSSGGYSYSAIAGRGDMPVNYVSFYDSLRFANWLHNGQLTGAQDGTTTEDGAYTITAQGVSDNSITRKAGATIFLTSGDEWYKAACYNALSTSYFDFPAGSDTQTICTAPTAAANSANCDAPESDDIDPDVDDLTLRGSFTGSASPYGTYDQGGNAIEWTERKFSSFSSSREVSGGSFVCDGLCFAASASGRGYYVATGAGLDTGFRVASIPEPGTGLLLITGTLELAGWRRRHS